MLDPIHVCFKNILEEKNIGCWFNCRNLSFYQHFTIYIIFSKFQIYHIAFEVMESLITPLIKSLYIPKEQLLKFNCPLYFCYQLTLHKSMQFYKIHLYSQFPIKIINITLSENTLFKEMLKKIKPGRKAKTITSSHDGNPIYMCMWCVYLYNIYIHKNIQFM